MAKHHECSLYPSLMHACTNLGDLYFHFKGETCFTNIDECESQPCQNGGHCVDLVDGFLCQCLPGYSGKVGESGWLESSQSG